MKIYNTACRRQASSTREKDLGRNHRNHLNSQGRSLQGRNDALWASEMGVPLPWVEELLNVCLANHSPYGEAYAVGTGKG